MASGRTERKLAAILATDMVGFGRYIETNEGETLARLKALRDELIDPVIARYRGEVLKRTGDGAYIRFDSVLVRCAVEVQRAKSMTISDSSRLMRRTNPRKD
jgi:adenylate cyclase